MHLRQSFFFYAPPGGKDLLQSMRAMYQRGKNRGYLKRTGEIRKIILRPSGDFIEISFILK
ncbi:MAG: hypothetical protein ACM3WV_11910 [Bacillota bacterium]